MAYIDDHGGKDKKSTIDGLNMYDGNPDGQPAGEGHAEVRETTEAVHETRTEGTRARKPKEGLLEKARRMLFGDRTLGEKVKSGMAANKAAGGIFQSVIATVSSPKRLTALVLGAGLGTFGLLGVFTSYKNDDLIRNDPPIRCEPGSIVMPEAGTGGDDSDAQEIVNILYDIFCNEFNYSPEALKGIVACMLVETGCNPDRLESDYLPAMKAAKEAFDAVAGPGTAPSSDVAQQAYWEYGELFKTQGGWNGNPFYMSDGGRMCPGIGLIQWTAGRANNFIRGLDKISMDVSPMDTHYQAAYLIAEMQTSYQACAPGSEFASIGDAAEATRIFFGNVVFGNPNVQPGNEHLDKRLAALNGPWESATANDLVDNAQANSEFTMDAVTMAEELAEEGFATSAAAVQMVQLCVNDTFVMTSDIAHAAVSISFLERGDYEDVQGAYGSYRRSARSPIMINDWDYIEGHNGNVESLSTPDTSKTYGSERGKTDERAAWPFYDIDLVSGGKLDLIACTEYYYFAHLIAFPKEIGVGGNAGYFSSCDRGTATAVRIAGADDKFPAGNPLYQLAWATGAAKQGAKHNENARGTQGAGFLWKFSGFMRGSDWYSASGSPSISAGTVMISWSAKAANGLLNENGGGGATSSGMLGVDGETGEAGSPEAGEPAEDEGLTGWAAKDEALKLAGLRWPMAVSNTVHHIITYVGDGTVNSFWGADWLYEQFQLFDDADRLVRKDLTETVPEVMQKGLAFKAQYAKKSSDQHMTFYKAQADGAKTNDDLKEFEPANGRKIEFNAKTGLPEFKSWEEIYVRLIHNSDDDAGSGQADGLQLYESADSFGNNSWAVDGKGDGYLDGLEEEQDKDEKVEQYDGVDQKTSQTVHNKFFFEDWNSLGIAKSTDSVKSDHINDYKDPTVDGGGVDKLIWYDGTDGNVAEPWTHARSALQSAYWRYELVTDIEYRANQFLRFGLASMMCSYPSEEDADTFQSGTEGSLQSGHIIGNVYRRVSRIPDAVDNSGRHYYYNTVVSNDMLQDLVQLYTLEKNAATDETNYLTGVPTGSLYENERNYGPMYLIGVGRIYGAGKFRPTSNSSNWVDRRYGLTAYDISTIMGGIEGNKMGMADADAVSDSFKHILTEPMHLLNDTQLSLYDNGVNSRTAAVKSAHEGDHLYNAADAKPYMTEVYGMNPFLMLEGASGLDIGSEMAAGLDNWEAGRKAGKSVRNDVEAALTGVSGGSGSAAKGIDPTDASGKSDDRLAWIDRHYFVTKNGGIGTFAYQVLALQPSAGTKMTSAHYEDELRAVKTLYAGHNGQTEDLDNLMGSKGLVQYTDFIYGEYDQDNKLMAKRLFGHDDRNKDGAETVNGARDDYNRRAFIVIPYYHTHAQQCDHKQLVGYSHYNLKCKWQNDTVNPGPADNLTVSSQAMIDTQVALNGTWSGFRVDRFTGSCEHTYNDDTDYGETISFNTEYVINRGKYDLRQLVNDSEHLAVRYFDDTGAEIKWNDKPVIHVTCNGWKQSNPCTADSSCRCSCYSPAVPSSGTYGEDDWDPGSPEVLCPCIPGASNCTNTICHACHEPIYCGRTHTHSCSDCLAGDWCHNHKECDDYGNMEWGDVQHACPCPYGSYIGHHEDGGTTGGGGQSDKCHYEYGCNALEYLYHNTDEDDGPRTHNGHHVNNLYMAITVAPGANIHDPAQFKISDWGGNGSPNSVKPDKCNLLQQVTYDGNGWVDNNWQTMVDGSILGSLLNPDMGGGYMGAVHSCLAGMETHTSAIKAGHPSEDFGMAKGLLQYFTIEGDSIHRTEDWASYLGQVTGLYGSPQSEYIRHAAVNGTPDDLVALESIRNRVGYGKEVTQTTSAFGSPTTRHVSQRAVPGANGSSTGEVLYDNSWHNESVDADSLSTGYGTGLGQHGWGEVAVTGTQHPKNPVDSQAGGTGYGDCEPSLVASVGNASVSGPDGSKGNNVYNFGASLLREILGDEHVVHVKFDTQDVAGLTEQDAGDNGRDFMYYPDKKQAARNLFNGTDEKGSPDGDFEAIGAPIKERIAGELGKSVDELTLSEFESNLKPSDYQDPESEYYRTCEDKDKFKGESDPTMPNYYGLFKKMDRDTLYQNYYTGELTDKMYAENIPPYNATDEKRTKGASEDNKKNIPLLAVESAEPDGSDVGGDATGLTVISDKEADTSKGGTNTPNTGDYRNWVTHASRGHRGMMTQYLNFASFFKDVYKSGAAAEQTMNYSYMLFEVVMRSDIKTSEDGGQDEYGNPMGSDDADKDRDWTTETVENDDGSHSMAEVTRQEGFVYKTPPSDAVDGTPRYSWGYGDTAGFSDTYGQGSNSHWKNLIDLYNAAMSETRQYGY